jgi:hypothetical protein
MTIDTGSRGLRFVASENSTRLIDARCGVCASCGVGRDYWCLGGRESGPVLAEIALVPDHGLARRWISALAALAAARHEPADTLLVLTDVSPDLATELVTSWHAGDVVVASDVRDPEMRHRLARLSSTGRAPLVFTATDIRAAVRAVERGGQVCGPDDGRMLPSVTELVQRDVTLVSPKAIGSLVTGSSWSVLADRLSTLLCAPTATGTSR